MPARLITSRASYSKNLIAARKPIGTAPGDALMVVSSRAAIGRSGVEQHEHRTLRSARPGGARDRGQGQAIGGGREARTAAQDTVEDDRVRARAPAAT